MLCLNAILEDTGERDTYDAYLVSLDRKEPMALLHLRHDNETSVALCPVEILPKESVEYFRSCINKAMGNEEKITASRNVLFNTAKCKQGDDETYIETDSNSPIAGYAFDRDMLSSLQNRRISCYEETYGTEHRKRRHFSFFMNSFAGGTALHPRLCKSINMQYKLTRGGNPGQCLQLAKRGKLFFVEETKTLSDVLKGLGELAPAPSHHEKNLQFALGGNESQLHRRRSFRRCQNDTIGCCCNIEVIEGSSDDDDDARAVKAICTRGRQRKCAKKKKRCVSSEKGGTPKASSKKPKPTK